MIEEQSMDQVFFDRLTRIVEANLENEQFGVKELAQEMGMSRSQIHRKLKAITQQSISQFIREIRLRKAMELLRQNVGTASEIAYRVGFGSSTYFNKCFHEYYGYPPGEVRKKNIGHTGSEKDFDHAKKDAVAGGFSMSRKLLIVSLGLLLGFTLAYFFFPLMGGKEEEKELLDKSIAVLPFKNLSEEASNEYFADGMMEDILNRLSHIHDLKVISRVSSDHYRESPKSLPQIASELGVSYVMEGSIQKCENKVRIFVQLIEARKDQYLWSKRYDAEFENLLPLQSDIAKHVASELKAVLTPEEIKQIERKPTKNMEAYNLYLQGRFFWNRRTEDGVKKSLKYFEQSIARDSTNALAYAGVADAYYILSWWGWYPKKEGYSKSKEFALKALKIDPMLAEAHATLGAIAHWAEWNWAEAEKELKYSIALNKNYATAHQYYAEYLSTVGKIDEAIEEINNAIELDPLSIIMHSLSGIYHHHTGQYDKALGIFQTVIEMNPRFHGTHIDIFYIYLKQGRDDEAIDELKRYLAKDSLDRKQIPFMEDAFDKSGKNGVLRWLIDLQIAKGAPEAYFIAELYAKLGQKEKALDWLEKSFYARDGIIGRLKYDHNLKNLHEEPRYKALLKKMGLDDE